MKRNYGIDLLRIISMFMVAILHTLGQGGVLNNTEPGSIPYIIAWSFEIFSYCAVNCFALISGYVLFQARFKLSRASNLWLQTAFYTVLAVAVFLLVKPGTVGKMEMLSALMPISSKQYWYISAYFGVLILMPLLNNVIAYTEEKVLRTCLLAAFILSCFGPMAFGSDPYAFQKGYSTAWLCLLYLAGGYIHKYDIVGKVHTSWAWLVLFGMFAVSCGVKFAAEPVAQYIPFLINYSNVFIAYTSPTIVLIALSLLVICSKMKICPAGEKIIKLISPATLGVYLSHVNPLVWEYWMKDFAVDFTNSHWGIMVCKILLSALLIFVAGIALEWIRIGLFRLCGIYKLSEALEKRLIRRLTKV